MLNEYMMTLQMMALKAKGKVEEFLYDEDGEVNIIAIIIILAIAIALAIVFREQLKGLFDQIWQAITGKVGTATGNY